MDAPIGLVYRAGVDSGPGAFARRAEELGYDSVWVSEAWGENAIAVLAEMAAETTSVRLGSAIVNVFSRTPALLAMSAASLDRVSDGRSILGLGTSHRRIVEDLHGVRFTDPLERLEETVELVRRFAGTDEQVSYAGEVFDVVGYPPLSTDIRIYNAALGPNNRRFTGRACDGWIPNQLPLTRIDEYHDAVADGAREVGRDPDEIEVMPWVPVAVNDDEAAARRLLRETIAFYVGSFPFYRRAVGERFPDEAAAISDAWEQGGREEAAGRVTDDLVDAMGIAGDAADAREALVERTANTVIDSPIVSFPPFADADVVGATIEALSPAGWG